MKDRSRPFAPPDLATNRGAPAVAAVKALEQGTARPDQQKLALDFIISDLAALYDEPFRPDEKGGERESSFAMGRMYVGRELRKMIMRPFTEQTGRKTSGEQG